MMQKESVKILKKENLSEYHLLYLKSDILLADAFENFRKMCLEIYELDQVNFLVLKDQSKIRISSWY